MSDWRDALPAVRGKLLRDEPLAPFTWLRVGGPAELIFLPEDADDLAAFLSGLDPAVPVTVLGVGSNTLVRDGGVHLINSSRGRVAQLQRWPDGLQAAVEMKEGLAQTDSGEVIDTIPAIDLLTRSAEVREAFDRGASVGPLFERWAGEEEAFRAMRRDYLLYE